MSTETNPPPPATDRGGVAMEEPLAKRMIESSVSIEILQGRNAETLVRFTPAASAALPIGELEVQALGCRQPWGTHTRPGRIKARTRAIRILVRAAQLALESAPELDADHVEAAIRSLAIRPADLLVNTITGAWISTPSAVRDRGNEVSRALVEVARIIKNVEVPQL